MKVFGYDANLGGEVLAPVGVTSCGFSFGRWFCESLVGRGGRFSFQSIPALKALGLDVGCDDMLQNFTTKASQRMNGSKPWRGPREKDSQFLQMLIQASSRPNDVVLDCTAMTGAFYLHSFSLCLGFHLFSFAPILSCF